MVNARLLSSRCLPGRELRYLLSRSIYWTKAAATASAHRSGNVALTPMAFEAIDLPCRQKSPDRGAHFPKFVRHRSAHLHELRKVMGTNKLIDSSTAYRFEVPGRDCGSWCRDFRSAVLGRI